MNIPIKPIARRALIVFKRSTIAAILGLVLSVMMPVFGLADSHHIQQPAASVASESSGFGGWIASKWQAGKEVVAGKYQAVTDPDHEIRMLKAEIRELEAQLGTKKLREEILAEDLNTLETCVSDLNRLFVTGRMQHLVKSVPNVPLTVE